MNKEFIEFKNKIINNVSKVIVGKNEVIEMIIVSFICGGHVLLEDIPGVGKTTLIKSFAKTLGMDFKRIQFTPDLLPSDVTGINFYNQKDGEFHFRKGPIFSNIVLADEINRATPRTQSSLLEAMEEKQVTIDGFTRELNEPFMVMATQNPIESYGTFPLPEAQKDRFFMRISIGYPSREDEIQVVLNDRDEIKSETLQSTVSFEEIEFVRKNYKKVTITDEVMNYLMNITELSRNKSEVEIGISPRGTIALFKASQAYAAINGREYIIPEDIKTVAPFIMNHRMVFKRSMGDKSIYSFSKALINEVSVPTEEIN